MKTVSSIPRSRPIPGLLLVVALGAAGIWMVPAAHADEHGGRGRHEQKYREHEFREHEFHDQRFLDHPYHHDRYYPSLGFVFRGLPPGYLSIGYRGSQYYFGGGVWYRTYAPGRFIVVAPPLGA